MTCIKHGGRDDGQQYDLQGSFRNMILPLTYESHDRQKTDRGTITLKLTYNSGRLEGKIALYSDPDDSIKSTDVTWFRSKKDLETYLHHLETREKASLEEYLKRSKEAEEARQKLKRETAPKQEQPVDRAAEGEANSEGGAEAQAESQGELESPMPAARPEEKAEADGNG
jgi:hypothetical protein